MSVFIKFARKYYEEALKDLERSRRAMSLEDYPQAVFYAQQCVEKGVKALLEVKRRVVYNHGPELISYFVEAYKDEWYESLERIVAALEFLTEYYTRARYPFLIRGEVIGPSEFVSKDIAVKALELAEKALEVVGDVLRRYGVI